ncbi:hypothetical protein AKO1_015613 [Acrasis kona]|uniref:Uncharacterized protein n=1 Tax=Acrasis kona TaxID=1008807 RepID=A0AAW2ZHL5_9EUKA
MAAVFKTDRSHKYMFDVHILGLEVNPNTPHKLQKKSLSLGSLGKFLDPMRLLEPTLPKKATISIRRGSDKKDCTKVASYNAFTKSYEFEEAQYLQFTSILRPVVTSPNQDFPLPRMSYLPKEVKIVLNKISSVGNKPSQAASVSFNLSEDLRPREVSIPVMFLTQNSFNEVDKKKFMIGKKPADVPAGALELRFYVAPRLESAEADQDSHQTEDESSEAEVMEAEYQAPPILGKIIEEHFKGKNSPVEPQSTASTAVEAIHRAQPENDLIKETPSIEAPPTESILEDPPVTVPNQVVQDAPIPTEQQQQQGEELMPTAIAVVENSVSEVTAPFEESNPSSSETIHRRTNATLSTQSNKTVTNSTVHDESVAIRNLKSVLQISEDRLEQVQAANMQQKESINILQQKNDHLQLTLNQSCLDRCSMNEQIESLNSLMTEYSKSTESLRDQVDSINSKSRDLSAELSYEKNKNAIRESTLQLTPCMIGAIWSLLSGVLLCLASPYISHVYPSHHASQSCLAHLILFFLIGYAGSLMSSGVFKKHAHSVLSGIIYKNGFSFDSLYGVIAKGAAVGVAYKVIDFVLFPLLVGYENRVRVRDVNVVNRLFFGLYQGITVELYARLFCIFLFCELSKNIPRFSIPNLLIGYTKSRVELISVLGCTICQIVWTYSWQLKIYPPLDMTEFMLSLIRVIILEGASSIVFSNILLLKTSVEYTIVAHAVKEMIVQI